MKNYAKKNIKKTKTGRLIVYQTTPKQRKEAWERFNKTLDKIISRRV